MLRWLPLTLSLLLLANCAFMVKENRVLTNALDSVVEPESLPTKVLLSPIFVPVGAVSLATDAIILHPVSVIPDAAQDTYETIWEEPEGTILWQTFLLVPKVVLSPVFFTFDWLARSLFDVG
ncbi:MAG: hypothetical protein KDK37_16070 [Leptospiraceae bacterium]|nr:hypothetical protein [Leptospiraceae bacterium]